jgi:hypothetical protein
MVVGLGLAVASVEAVAAVVGVNVAVTDDDA